jgi:hypothetical protein
MLQCSILPGSLLVALYAWRNRVEMADVLGLSAKLAKLPRTKTDARWLSLTFAARLKNGLFVKSSSDFRKNFS